MLRATTLAVLTAALLGTTAVSAQVVDLGRGGPTIDLRSPGDRERDYEREEIRRDGERRDLTTGNVRGGCSSVTVTKQDGDGNSVTRRRDDC